MPLKTPTARPTAKLRATGLALAIGALLPVVNVVLAKLGLPSIGEGDVAEATSLVLAAYTALVGVVAFVRGYLRRPEAADTPVPDHGGAGGAGVRPPGLVLLPLLAASGLLGAGPVQAQTFRAVDYGVVADSTVNNVAALQRLSDAARDGRKPGQTARMILPPGVIGYAGEWKIEADSLTVEGCGGAVVTRDVLPSAGAGGSAGTARGDARGGDSTVYYPVRRADAVTPPGPDGRGGACVTRLRVLDNAQGTPQPSLRGETVTRISLRNDKRQRDGSVRRQHRFGMFSLVLDGNESGQLAPVRRHIAAGKSEDLYRNAPGHSAINATRNGGADFSADGPTAFDIGGGRTLTREGQRVGLLVTLRGVEVTGYVAAGILGDQASRWSLNTVRLEDSAYNHIAYAADGGVVAPGFERDPLASWGGWTDVTVAGHAWGYVIVNRGLAVTRLVLEEPTRSPIGRDAADVINIRGGDVVIRGLTQAPSPAAWPRVFNVTAYAGETGTVLPSLGPPPAWTPTTAAQPPTPEAGGADVPSAEAPAQRYQWRDWRRCVDTATGRYARAALCTSPRPAR